MLKTIHLGPRRWDEVTKAIHLGQGQPPQKGVLHPRSPLTFVPYTQRRICGPMPPAPWPAPSRVLALWLLVLAFPLTGARLLIPRIDCGI